MLAEPKMKPKNTTHQDH